MIKRASDSNAIPVSCSTAAFVAVAGKPKIADPLCPCGIRFATCSLVERIASGSNRRLVDCDETCVLADQVMRECGFTTATVRTSSSHQRRAAVDPAGLLI